MKSFLLKLNIIPRIEHNFKYFNEIERNNFFDVVKRWKLKRLTNNINSPSLDLSFTISYKNRYDMLKYDINVNILRFDFHCDYIFISPSWKYNELYINGIKQETYSFMIIREEIKLNFTTLPLILTSDIVLSSAPYRTSYKYHFKIIFHHFKAIFNKSINSIKKPFR